MFTHDGIPSHLLNATARTAAATSATEAAAAAAVDPSAAGKDANKKGGGKGGAGEYAEAVMPCMHACTPGCLKDANKKGGRRGQGRRWFIEREVVIPRMHHQTVSRGKKRHHGGKAAAMGNGGRGLGGYRWRRVRQASAALGHV